MESANPTSLQPGEPFNPYGLFNGIFIPEAICKFRGLSLGAKVVYGRLYRFAGKDGKAYPSVPTLGAEVGISAKQARRYVRELEDQRFIRSERTTGRQNHYLFLWHTAFIGESGQPRKVPLPKMGVPTPPMNGSTTPPEDGSQRESGERESPTRESAKTDYQRTNRTNRDSHAGARGDAIDEPSENQTPRPKPSSSERIQFTQEEREWMSGALDSYGQRRTMRQHMQESAPPEIVQKCLEAADGTPLQDIGAVLRHRCLHGCEPGTTKGPHSWGWFPTVIANAVRAWREQEAAANDPSLKKHWSEYNIEPDSGMERANSAFDTLDDVEATA